MSTIHPKLSWTATHDAKRVYVSAPYAITFGRLSADIWLIAELATDTTSLTVSHVAQLSNFGKNLQPPSSDRIVTDPGRALVAILNDELDPPALSVWSLTDGTHLRTISLYGSITDAPVRYESGQAIIAVQEPTEEYPDGLNTLLRCDVAGDGYVLGGAPYDDAESIYPVLLSTDGHMVAAAVRGVEQNMTLLRWRDTDSAGATPSTAVELPLSGTDPDCDCLAPSCSVPLGDRAFLLAALEVCAGAIWDALHPQTVLYAVEADTLSTRWRAEPVYGQLHSLHYVAALGLVVGVGARDMREDAGESDPATFVAVWDAGTGALKKLDGVSHKENGCAVECFVSSDEREPCVVVLSRNGNVLVTRLMSFVEGGFERREGKLAVTYACKLGAGLARGAVGKCSLLVVDAPEEDGDAESSWQMSYLTW